MRLILTLTSPLGVFAVSTDEETVGPLGMEGAIALLRKRAYAHVPEVSWAECTTRCAFHDAPQERFRPL